MKSLCLSTSCGKKILYARTVQVKNRHIEFKRIEISHCKIGKIPV